ncbi:DoxX family protein [Alicyclobacillus fodiniaquatilis]|uniref:DoxX family protein n=1 Tax=Alicyclobacillus fodiniaquatilis TaxID=1661150 RepID=A0ABW4JNP1_9BACL
MFIRWLRSSRYASVILAALRIYLGWTFLHAGWSKLTATKSFNAAGFLINSVKHPVLNPEKHAVYPWYNSFLSGFAIPHIGVFNFLIPWGEFFVGLGLMLGVLTTTAACFGILMNFMYMFAGSVSTNPVDILCGMFIIVAGFNSGFIGFDYLLIPYIRKTITTILGKQAPNNNVTRAV